MPEFRKKISNNLNKSQSLFNGVLDLISLTISKTSKKNYFKKL